MIFMPKPNDQPTNQPTNLENKTISSLIVNWIIIWVESTLPSNMTFKYPNFRYNEDNYENFVPN